MYRFGRNGTITYVPEDMILFRGSPFASWMERLTLENPDHGIAHDKDPEPLARREAKQREKTGMSPGTAVECATTLEWDDFIRAEAVLKSGVKKAQDSTGEVFVGDGDADDVLTIEPYLDESQRRQKTLDAMRSGVKFVTNGQVAVGPFSAAVDLLVRSGGASEFGDYFYTPCNTRQSAPLNSVFGLCFVAEILSELQGKLPPRILSVQANGEMLSRRTEDHIVHFREVKKRFLKEQLSFQQHRVPDPVESSHFGRWSDCARDLVRQRSVSRGQRSANDARPAELEKTVGVGAETQSQRPLEGRAAGSVEPSQEGSRLALISQQLSEYQERSVAGEVRIQRHRSEKVDLDRPHPIQFEAGASRQGGIDNRLITNSGSG